MLNLKFLNLAKPKKVFEKLNKMDRKQAYTVGAIIVVAVIALLMLVSSLDTEGDSLEGMNPRGYDLAAMPFVNDEAEKMLLASYYPDMRENGSTLLYTPLEREQREQADLAEYELVPVVEDGPAGNTEQAAEQEQAAASGGASGSGGSGRRGKGAGAGRTPTEIGKLTSANVTSSGGSGFNSSWNPSVDNRGLNGQAGSVAPAQLQTGDARKTLGQFRAGSFAASRLRDNKMANARKAMMGGNIQGSQAFGKNGIDASKLGGLALDTSELPKTTDLGNLDDKVDNAVKEHEKPEKPEEKLSFWEQLGQDLLRQAASSLVDSITSGIGDSIKGWVNGNSASRAAGKKVTAERMGVSYDNLTATERQALTDAGITKEAWDGGKVSTRKAYSALKGHSTAVDTAREQAKADARSQAIGSSGGKNNSTGVSGCANGKTLTPIKDKDGKDTGTYTCQ